MKILFIKKKSQAALEFLTTYAWAFLAILILIGALGYFGILSPSKFLPERCNFGAEIGCTDYVIASNGVQLRLKNNAGNPIIVDAVTVSNEKAELTCISSITGSVWDPGEIIDVPVTCSDFTATAGLVQGNKEKLSIQLKYYDVGSGTAFTKAVQGEVFAVAGNENVSNDYLGGGGGGITGLVAAYSFNENDGATLTDVSGNGNDGTIYGNTMLLMNFDDTTADDKSVYNNDGTISGADCNAEGAMGIGKGCSFDGVDDYVNTALNVDNSQSFSVEAWVNTNSLAMSDWQKVMVGDRTAGAATFELYLTQTTSMYAFLVFNDAGNSFTGSSDRVAAVGEWTHLVGVFDANAKTVTIYNNGVKGTQKTVTGTSSNGAGVVRIGWGINAARYFNGLIDEVAVYSKALSQEEIEQHYNAKKAKFAEWVDGKPGYGSALSFDGVDDYVTASGNAFNINNNVTISAWFYPKFVPQDSNIKGIISNGFKWSFYLQSGRISGFFNDQSSGVNYLPSLGPININQWYHFAATYDYTTNIMSLYLNGVRTDDTPNGALVPITTTIKIGDSAWQNQFFNGLIDSVAIYDRVLTPEEIALQANS